MKHKLYVVLLGGRPFGATIEQHNVFFGVGNTLKSLFPAIKRFWPAAVPHIHIDAFWVANNVDGYDIVLSPNSDIDNNTGHSLRPHCNEDNQNLAKPSEKKLFFVNLGGYEAGVFAEKHKRLLIVASSQTEAMEKAKTDSFFQTGIMDYAKKGRPQPHIDDKHQLTDFSAFDDHHTPLDVGELVKPQKYTMDLRQSFAKSCQKPKIIITGYLKVS